jgi:hypothetical protein
MAETHSRLMTAFMVIFFIVWAVMCIGLAGQTPTLTCTRVGPGEPINCIKQAKLLGFITLGEEAIQGVQGAILDGKDCADGGYVVELLTVQGNVALNIVCEGINFQSKSDQVNQINDFVSGVTPVHKLVIADQGIFTPQYIIGLFIAFMIVSAVLWRRWAASDREV